MSVLVQIMNDSQIKLKPAELRAETAKRLWRVIKYDHSESIDNVLKPVLENPEQQAWMGAAIYGCCRYYPRYQNQLIQLLKKPIKDNEGEVKALLILGMHQLSEMKVKAHAAINETVNACKVLEKLWAVKLVNGILRNYQRGLDCLAYKTELTQYAHPKWIIKQIKQDYPQHWRDILDANNQQAPMTLRVNVQKITTAAALKMLQENGIACEAHEFVTSAIVLQQALAVEQIPYFFEGYFSVQDTAAQMAAHILIGNDSSQSIDVLDACCAPGGKTGHLLERMHEQSSLMALDISSKRLELVHDNLQRLANSSTSNKKVQIVCADASDLDAWNPESKLQKHFDRILLDVPCSASGVIRRHPDIKFRRTHVHIQELSQVQANMLQTMWSVLKPRGSLLYATCSVFKQENMHQIEKFLDTHDDAKVLPLNINNAINTNFGSQILPGASDCDGFFYCLLEKN